MTSSNISDIVAYRHCESCLNKSRAHLRFHQCIHIYSYESVIVVYCWAHHSLLSLHNIFARNSSSLGSLISKLQFANWKHLATIGQMHHFVLYVRALKVTTRKHNHQIALNFFSSNFLFDGLLLSPSESQVPKPVLVATAGCWCPQSRWTSLVRNCEQPSSV